MKILVRLPNWLGDMVMSIGFINALRQLYPDASISVIVKTGFEDLLDHFPPIDNRYLFSKQEYADVAGAFIFGKDVSAHERYDMYFSLPDSFSAAAMGWMSRAGKRIGYQKEGRNFLLTDSYKKDPALHRVDQYIALAENFAEKTTVRSAVRFGNLTPGPAEHLLVNINSEAVSRRLPVMKAVSILQTLREKTDREIFLIGGRNDAEFVEGVISRLPNKKNIRNIAGATSIKELIHLMAGAKAILTTDSGPAHLANACALPALVLFGAGNEYNTAPYNKDGLMVVRYGQLPCEPCVSNQCKLYGIPKCLEMLDEEYLTSTVLSLAATAR